MMSRLITIAIVLAARVSAAAGADHYGRVTFGAVPVPGATVTAVRGDQQRVTVTDPHPLPGIAERHDASVAGVGPTSTRS